MLNMANAAVDGELPKNDGKRKYCEIAGNRPQDKKSEDGVETCSGRKKILLSVGSASENFLNNSSSSKYNGFCLEDFSDEILVEILKNLDTWTLLTMMSLNLRFQTLIQDSRFWLDICLGSAPLPLGILEDILERSHAKTNKIQLCGPSPNQQLDIEVKHFNSSLSKAFLDGCVNLSILELKGVTVDFRTVPIHSFPKLLKRLVLNNCNARMPKNPKTLFTGIDGQFLKLEELGIEDNTWFDPYYIVTFSKLPGLKYLSLKGCQHLSEFVAYGSIAARFGFKKLEHLDLRFTPIANSDLQCFNAIKGLKVLLLEKPDYKPPAKDKGLENLLDCDKFSLNHRRRRMVFMDPLNEFRLSVANHRADIPTPPIPASSAASTSAPQPAEPTDNESAAPSAPPAEDVEANNRPVTMYNAVIRIGNSVQSISFGGRPSNDSVDEEPDPNRPSTSQAAAAAASAPAPAPAAPYISASSGNKAFNSVVTRCMTPDNRCVTKISFNLSRERNQQAENDDQSSSISSTTTDSAENNPSTEQNSINTEASSPPSTSSQNSASSTLTESSESSNNQRTSPDRSAINPSSPNGLDSGLNMPQQIFVQVNNNANNDAINNNNNNGPDLLNNVLNGEAAAGGAPVNGADPAIVVRHIPEQAFSRAQIIYRDGNRGQVFLHNFLRRPPPSLDQFFDMRVTDAAANRGCNQAQNPRTITDRGICSFGRPMQPIIQNIIWIRIDNRPSNNNFTRLVVRNYKYVTNASLEHLAHCSPNLIYLDVSGTGVTKEGIEQFKKMKPDCEVIADHLNEQPEVEPENGD